MRCVVLKIRQQDGLREITIANASVHNAIGPDDARELREAFEAAAADPETRVVLLSAEGSSFCAGGNLRQIVAMVAGGPSVVSDVIYTEFQGMMQALEALDKPLLCAVDGPAIGLGCDLALAADLTFMGPEASLSQGWAALGLVSAPGGTRIIMRRGGQRALWRLMSERRIAAAEAETLGLALMADNAREAALRAARILAALPQDAVRVTKQLSRIDDAGQHLSTALAHQIGFLTGRTFAEKAEAILGRERA